MPLPRKLWGVRGDPAATAAEVCAWWEARGRPDLLWVGDPPANAPGDLDVVTHAGLRGWLGRTVDAVVLDLHERLDPNALGRAHGLIRRGGVLILRLGPEAPRRYHEGLRCEGHADSHERFWRRLGDHVDRGHTPESPPAPSPCAPPSSLSPTADQSAVMAALQDADAGVLLADRGRGKSVTLGWLAQAAAEARLTGPSAMACAEATRIARTPWTPLPELLRAPPSTGTVLIDEAAQLPVPLLQRLVRTCPQVRFVFATTVAGYEGTGRGFALRFVPWLRARREVREATLQAPIRWDEGDPLEAWTRELLVLDAGAEVESVPTNEPTVRCEVLDREALAKNEAQLRQVFGLLVAAHYRTTPADLMRLLDAANLRVHVAWAQEAIVGVTLLALEGGLDAATRDAMHRGARRVRGHALPDTVVSHLGEREAAALTMVRSVRIATDPWWRRRGIASALVRHVHASYPDADLVGTLFGATPELLRFRRALGYRLVRLGFSRGSRTGEPSAVMMWPRSDAAHALVERLRGRFAWELPRTLAMLDAEVALDPTLRDALLGHGASPAPPDVAADVAHYATGPRPFEAAASSLARWLEGRDRSGLDPVGRRLLELKLDATVGWAEAAEEVGLPVPSAMRQLRAAVRTLLEIAP